MGLVDYNTVVQKTLLYNDTLNKTSRSFLNEVTKSNSQFINSSNTQNVVLKNAHCKGITIKQSGNITATAISKMDNKQTSKLITQLNEKIKSGIKREIEQENKGFRGIFGNVNKTYVNDETINKVQNVIENSIRNTINDFQSQNINGSQIQTVVLEDFYSPDAICKVDQSFVINAVADTITKNITSDLQETIMDTDVSQTADTKTSQKNAGLFANFTTMVTGLLSKPLMIVAVIATIAGCIYLYQKYGKKDLQATQTRNALLGYRSKRSKRSKRSLKYKNNK